MDLGFLEEFIDQANAGYTEQMNVRLSNRTKNHLLLGDLYTQLHLEQFIDLLTFVRQEVDFYKQAEQLHTATYIEQKLKEQQK